MASRASATDLEITRCLKAPEDSNYKEPTGLVSRQLEKTLPEALEGSNYEESNITLL